MCIKPCAPSLSSSRIRRFCRASADEQSVSTDAASTSQSSAASDTAKQPAKAGKGFGKSAPPTPAKNSSATTLPSAGSSGSIGEAASSPPSPGVVRRPAPQRPLLSTEAQRQQEQDSAKIETFIVSSLATAFVLILVEGIFLASAGTVQHCSLVESYSNALMPACRNSSFPQCSNLHHKFDETLLFSDVLQASYLKN